MGKGKYRMVFVAAPASLASGGPELSHQLVFALRRMGVDAVMYYYGQKEDADPVHPEFKQYENPFVFDIDDKEDCLLVVPETRTQLLSRFSHLKKAIWWMSVDFYYKTIGLPLEKHRLIENPIYRFFWILRRKKRRHDFLFGSRKNNNLLHLVQSEYARFHVVSKGVSEENVLYLSDYLNHEFFKEIKDDKVRRNIVVYNPKKGVEFTKRIIESLPGVKFVPIENMTRDEVSALLCTAKLYIDFGEHPGKDRIPREACVQGTCVITGMNGSAAFDDVPLPEGFKFHNDSLDIPKISEAIKACLENYEDINPIFDDYRNKIRSEEDRFYKDAAKLVGI